MTSGKPNISQLIDQARQWPREVGEGFWFNAMADELQRLERIERAARALLAEMPETLQMEIYPAEVRELEAALS